MPRGTRHFLLHVTFLCLLLAGQSHLRTSTALNYNAFLSETFSPTSVQLYGHRNIAPEVGVFCPKMINDSLSYVLSERWLFCQILGGLFFSVAV